MVKLKKKSYSLFPKKLYYFAFHYKKKLITIIPFVDNHIL